MTDANEKTLSMRLANVPFADGALGTIRYLDANLITQEGDRRIAELRVQLEEAGKEALRLKVLADDETDARAETSAQLAEAQRELSENAGTFAKVNQEIAAAWSKVSDVSSKLERRTALLREGRAPLVRDEWLCRVRAELASDAPAAQPAPVTVCCGQSCDLMGHSPDCPSNHPEPAAPDTGEVTMETLRKVEEQRERAGKAEAHEAQLAKDLVVVHEERDGARNEAAHAWEAHAKVSKERDELRAKVAELELGLKVGRKSLDTVARERDGLLDEVDRLRSQPGPELSDEDVALAFFNAYVSLPGVFVGAPAKDWGEVRERIGNTMCAGYLAEASAARELFRGRRAAARPAEPPKCTTCGGESWVNGNECFEPCEACAEGQKLAARIAELWECNPKRQPRQERSAEATNTPRDLLGWLYRCQTPKSEQGDGTWSDGVQELFDAIVSAIERLQRDVSGKLTVTEEMREKSRGRYPNGDVNVEWDLIEALARAVDGGGK